METYSEMKSRHRNITNELPMFGAFSDAQFAEALEERGLTIDDTDKIASFGLGMFYLKRDHDLIFDTLERHRAEILEAMKDPGFAYDAFLYEMGNHEYHINWQADYDVCSCFGYVKFGEEKGGLTYLREMGFPDETLRAYEKARSEFYRQCDENEWW